jgi:pre-mRNA-processing factor 40
MPPEYKIILDQVGELNPLAVPIDLTPAKFKSREDGFNEFFRLLENKGVTCDDAWEEVLVNLVTSPVYRGLAMSERLTAFNRYQSMKKDQEKGNRIKKFENDREKLRRVFSTTDKISGTMNFKTIANICRNDPIYRSTAEEHREKIWEEYSLELRRREKEIQREARKEQMAKLRDLLVKMNLDVSCRWRDVKPKIEGHRTFSSLTHLDNIDVLLAFEDHMASLEKKVTINATKRMIDIKRSERRNRKDFKNLLKSFESEGIIRPYTLWRDVVRDFEKKEAYKNLLGQPGSTPLDLFRDLIVQMNLGIEDECKEIKRTVRNQDIVISSKTTFNDFQFQLASARPGFSKDALKVVFDEMLDSILARIRDDKKRESKKLKRRMDALKSILKHLDPPITPKTTWSEAAARISHKSDYQDLEEEHRLAVFEKFISKLTGKSHREAESGNESDEKLKHRKEKKRHRRRRSGSPNSHRNSSDEEDRHRSSKKKKSSSRYDDDRYSDSRHQRSSRDYKDHGKNPRNPSDDEEGQVSD